MKAIVIAIVLCASVARADDAPPELVSSIARLVDEHHAGAAYAKLIDVIAQHPTDASVRRLAALCALRLARRDEAREHLDAGLAAHPDDAGLLGLSSRLGFVEGDIMTARAEAERALALSPSQTDAQATLDDLDWSERATDPQAAADLAPGSPRWFVDHALRRLFGGADAPELSALLGIDLLRGLPPDQRTRGTLLDLTRAMLAHWAADREHTKVDYQGWAIGDVTTAGDRISVDVHLSLSRRFTQDDVDELGRLYADPATRAQIAPAMQEQLGEVDDADRPALLARLVGQHSVLIEVMRVELVPDGTDYQVSDVVYDGVDYAQLIPISPVVHAALERRPHATPVWIWLAVGVFVIGMLGVTLGFVISALRGPGRARRRR